MFEKFLYLLRNLKKPSFKVGFISYYYPTKNDFTNGVSVHAYYLSRKLAERGCEVHIFTNTDRNFVKEEYLNTGKLVIHGLDLGFNENIKDDIIKKRMRYLLFDQRVISEISSENNKRKFDIIHTHGWLTAGAFISRMFNNIHWIHTFHALEKGRLRFMTPEEKKYLNLTQWIESTINHADALIAVSNYLKGETIKTFKLEGKKVIYIPNGVDISLFNNKHAVKEKKIIFVGRFSLEKGIDLVADTFKKILDTTSNVKVVLVAKTSRIESLQGIIKEFEDLEKKYPARFSWIKDSQDRRTIANLYKNAMICIQPSRYEAFGLSAIEAMACGDVVICSNQGGLPEVVGHAGFVVSPKSEDFVTVALKLLNNPKLRKKYASRGIQRASQYDWDSIAAKTFELYRVIAKNKKYPISEEGSFPDLS